MKKRLCLLSEERLTPREVKPCGFVDLFFAHQGKKMVGVRGFEPPASASRTQRSSQTEPHIRALARSEPPQVAAAPHHQRSFAGVLRKKKIAAANPVSREK
ncbi:MAG: hypothetical protein IJS01_07130 [Lentisphaeria bacterium]|nr:hypothetical protein [Lentisphaeria bacterium]